MAGPRDLSVSAQGGRPPAPNVLLHAHPSQMYLSKEQNLFLQIPKCIGRAKIQSVFVKGAKYICPICKMFGPIRVG